MIYINATHAAKSLQIGKPAWGKRAGFGRPGPRDGPIEAKVVKARQKENSVSSAVAGWSRRTGIQDLALNNFPSVIPAKGRYC
ncbi:hypothetical protein Pnap_0304 [Polaromonas naphthalenivorans CJ2]|uniref:Uncharacterized protein n=1 Tax=Polaromonas naphthalenivorans (strain CJ2) TaxID=365044 RepID=A1VIZ9_POLNA|nr:hypothetical protein Pnap_0304 [Polaromonas naphthalenivorans CJ2]